MILSGTQIPTIKKDELLFAKVREDAKIPSKRDEDGCYDIYACFDDDFIIIKPREIKLIPTGIASCFSSKCRLSIRERGSTGSIGMSVRAGQIDSGYRNEIFVAINNTSNKDIVIKKGITDKVEYNDRIEYPYIKAIAQAALEFVPDIIVKEVNYEELKNIPSDRGMGCLGSTNN